MGHAPAEVRARERDAEHLVVPDVPGRVLVRHRHRGALRDAERRVRAVVSSRLVSEARGTEHGKNLNHVTNQNYETAFGPIASAGG